MDEPKVYDLKSPEQGILLPQLLDQWRGLHKPELNEKWVYYVNGVRWDHASRRIRPRSQVTAFNINSSPPELEVIDQTPHLIIINKRPGLPTQKTLKRNEDNLYDQVRRWRVLKEKVPAHLPYVGLHHRLDRDTSGLVLMTLKTSANREVADLFKFKRIKKTYRAVTSFGSSLPPQSWRVDNLIRRSKVSKKRLFRFEVAQTGDRAITDFMTLKSWGNSFHEIQCSPITGRTHQLRVHLSEQGWPILGDPIYGAKKDKHKVDRLMLHAQSLEFTFLGKSYVFEVEPNWSLPISADSE
jgi:23S rRNA pseudouridine955/2504/2580 synthase